MPTIGRWIEEGGVPSFRAASGHPPGRQWRRETRRRPPKPLNAIGLRVRSTQHDRTRSPIDSTRLASGANRLNTIGPGDQSTQHDWTRPRFPARRIDVTSLPQFGNGRDFRFPFLERKRRPFSFSGTEVTSVRLVGNRAVPGLPRSSRPVGRDWSAKRDFLATNR